MLSYHLIPFLIGIIAAYLGVVLSRGYYGKFILKLMALLLLVYKSIQYIVANIDLSGELPAEISAITYFLSPLILLLKRKKLYHVVAFFSILCGGGFIAGYTFFGFAAVEKVGFDELIIASLSHGCLLMIGIYLLIKYPFENYDVKDIWLYALGSVLWAAVYYGYFPDNDTFMNYLISPDKIGIGIGTTLLINLGIYILFYIFLVVSFSFIIKTFYAFNRALHRQDLITDYGLNTNNEIKNNKNSLIIK